MLLGCLYHVHSPSALCHRLPPIAPARELPLALRLPNGSCAGRAGSPKLARNSFASCRRDCVIEFGLMSQFRWFGLACGIAFGLVMGSACSSTSSNEAGSGGSAGAGGAASDCCTARQDPGCSDKTLQACVCLVDPACCSGSWNAFCVATAEVNCNACGAGGAGGSGGTSGFGGEPAGGFGGGACLGAVPVPLPDPCLSVIAPLPAGCCSYGSPSCDDSMAVDCAAAISQDCKMFWSDCCAGYLQEAGFCVVDSSDAGQKEGGGSGSADSGSADSGS